MATTSAPRGLTFPVDAVECGPFKQTGVTIEELKSNFLDDGEVLEHLHLDTTSSDEVWGVGTVPTPRASGMGHQFFTACLKAFAEHQGLVLSADMIWQMILESLSVHVSQHPEELRATFVQHEGKVKIELIRDEFVLGSEFNDWDGLVDEFGKEIQRRSNPGVYEDIVGTPFSTTTQNDVVCRQIALMSTVKHFFSYSFATRCGYPTVTLLGTREDYVLLQDKVRRLGQYMLPTFANHWLPALESILVHFISVWDGEIDKHFWGSCCKNGSTRGSGAGTFVSGWINILFPFIGSQDEANTHCLPWSQLSQKVLEEEELCRTFRKPGNRVSEFARRCCFAEVEWNYCGHIYPLVFKAGFIGHVIDPVTTEITPGLAWGIAHAAGSDKQ